MSAFEEARFILFFNFPHLLGNQSQYPDGFSSDNPDFSGDWDHCLYLYQNLLQQRTLCQFVPPNIGYYSNNLLLDDVGDCISCTNETAHSPYPYRGMIIFAVKNIVLLLIQRYIFWIVPPE
ncbi:hypothetical protein Q3G72_026200 [Acer saccharum]|nr:hypothetical protein Q3G72_026200 [Acer saccharum]